MAAKARNPLLPPPPPPPPPPPRSLNVQRLADARRPEMQSLHSVVSSRLSDRFRLPRSLRRRTTSHLRLGVRGPNRNKAERRRRRRRSEARSNAELGFVAAADGSAPKRLRTHVWHAKRFEMAKRWGLYLALKGKGKGRGARALLLHYYHNGALLHDATYFLPIQLQGPQDSLLSVLRMLLTPLPPPPENGSSHQDALLYRTDSSPPHLIAPVNYMWHPIPSQTPEYCHSSSLRKLWIWIHAAAFHDGYNALRAACQKQQMYSNSITVTCLPQEGRIARLDIMGAKASQLLTKILCPLTISDETADRHPVPCTNSAAQKQFSVDQIEKLPPGVMLTLRVKDPRLLSSELCSEFVPVNLESLHTCNLYDNSELWDSRCRIDPPVPESILCAEKNKRRLNTLFLEPASQEMPADQQKDGFSRSCTIILLKHAYQATFSGWSIILPLSWVKPFWLSMASRGGHAIGLRERRWVAWKNQVPSFPHDFPDTEAYKSLLTDQDALLDASAQLWPHSRQPQKTTMPPPWDCVIASSHHICRTAMQCKVQTLYICIPRTTEALKDCVEKMDSGDLVSAGSVGITDDEREKGSVCLVRVLVRAFNEGLFEDGAVICAPCTDDLSGWNTRSEEVEEYQEKWQLQITQSAVESYFIQVEPDRLALQVPEDPINLKSFRWPIGFITTGVVHACNDRVAMGFCDIRILAALRRQQFVQTKIKRPEILVLVRNMKSTAYRRAVATIVLEQQQDDVQFL